MPKRPNPAIVEEFRDYRREDSALIASGHHESIFDKSFLLERHEREKTELITGHEAILAKMQEENQSLSVELMAARKSLRGSARQIHFLCLGIIALILVAGYCLVRDVGCKVPTEHVGHEVIKPLDGRAMGAK